jgi:hypothetical protein
MAENSGTPNYTDTLQQALTNQYDWLDKVQIPKRK